MGSTWFCHRRRWEGIEEANLGVRVQAGVLTVANASAASCGSRGWIQKRGVAFVSYPLPPQRPLPSPRGLEIKPQRVNQRMQLRVRSPRDSPKGSARGHPPRSG